MSTERIYREDQYRVSNTARVTGIREKNGCDVIACSSSVFYPEGGGQPSDTGTAACAAGLFAVVHASDESLNSDVWHETDAPYGTFSLDDEVCLTIDWDLRFSHMQRHLGEHMLSGAMDSLFAGTNKGFHMGADYVTIDIDLGGRMLSADELDLAERRVNEAVWADLPVTTTWFDDYESSLVLPVRKAVPHEGRVSVVTVGSLSDPFDCIACCGTHPARSSEVGLIAIYKCEPNKGMNRIYFDCGRCAKDKLSADSRMLYEISKKYSCSPSDLTARLEAEAVSISDMKARISSMSSYIMEKEREKIEGDLAGFGAGSPDGSNGSKAGAEAVSPDGQDGSKAGAKAVSPDRPDGSKAGAKAVSPDRPDGSDKPRTGSAVIFPSESAEPMAGAAGCRYIYRSDILSADELLKLGFSVINRHKGLFLVLVQKETRTCLLLSSDDNVRCGEIVKSNAKRFGGRGGGRPDNARALFSSSSDMEAFIAEVVK